MHPEKHQILDKFSFLLFFCPSFLFLLLFIFLNYNSKNPPSGGCRSWKSPPPNWDNIEYYRTFMPLSKSHSFSHQERRCQKCRNCRIISLIFHASKLAWILKILQQKYLYIFGSYSKKCPVFNPNAGKEDTRVYVVNVHWLLEHSRTSQEKISLCFLVIVNALCGSSKEINALHHLNIDSLDI